jgi:excisionase family DNA binding protein
MVTRRGSIRRITAIAAAARRVQESEGLRCGHPAVPHCTEEILVTVRNFDNDPGLHQLIDIPTLASSLGTTIRHIRRLVAEKRVPYMKVGHLVRFDPKQIREWLSEHSQRVLA